MPFGERSLAPPSLLRSVVARLSVLPERSGVIREHWPKRALSSAPKHSLQTTIRRAWTVTIRRSIPECLGINSSGSSGSSPTTSEAELPRVEHPSSASRPSRDDVAVGWEALDRWGDDVARIEPLTAGGVNEVWSVRVNGQLAVARLGRRGDRRSDADLAWETELLRYLDREGMAVPVPIPTTDGRDFVDGLVVMSYVEGGPPETEAEWRRVADTFRQLHRLTHGWPQRPGWRSSIDFLHVETGTRIDLGAMPPEGVARCRAVWARLSGRERCVVHGDPTRATSA